MTDEQYADILNNYDKKEDEEKKKEVKPKLKKKRVIKEIKEEPKSEVKIGEFPKYKDSEYKKAIEWTFSILATIFGKISYFCFVTFIKVITWIVRKIEKMMKKQEEKVAKA